MERVLEMGMRNPDFTLTGLDRPDIIIKPIE
jgi:hypothetical protein